MRIQHNIMAMNAYRNYNLNTKALSGNLEKLSSGYKINRAGDDAAGLAISEKMRAQITGLDAAQKNVKDGISLVKTAEGAMQEIQDMLNRMDYLATQSANGTYDNEVDRANLQKEVEALKTEINRIADSANFNGIQLLDGSQSAGGSSGVSVNVDLKVENAACGVGQLHGKGVKAQSAAFEIDLKQAIYTASAKATIAANSSFTLNVKVGDKTFAVKVTTKASIAKGGVISQGAIGNLTFACSAATTTAGVEITSGSDTAKFTGTLGNDGVLKFALKSGEPKVDFNAAMDVTIEGDGTKIEFKAGDDYKTTYNCNTQNVSNGFAAKNDKLAHGEFEFTKNMANALFNGGSLKLGDAKYDQIEITFDKNTLGKDATGTTVGVKDLLDANGNIKVDDKSLAEMVARISKAANGSNTFTVGAGSSDKMISLTEKYDYYDSAADGDDKLIDTKAKFQNLISVTGGSSGANSAGGLTLQIGDTAASYNQLTVSIGDMHTSAMKSAAAGNSIADIDIGTQQGAQEAVQTIRDAINYVSGVRGDLGAVQNRLDHTGNNLAVMAENIQDAESTIRDTDVADEMMKYVKNNILVQSAQAMLAQANQVPQGVLQLLG